MTSHLFPLLILAAVLLSPIPARAQPPDYDATAQVADWQASQARRAKATATAQANATSTAHVLQTTATAQEIKQRTTETAKSAQRTSEALRQLATESAQETQAARQDAEWATGATSTTGVLRAKGTNEAGAATQAAEARERGDTALGVGVFCGLGVLLFGSAFLITLAAWWFARKRVETTYIEARRKGRQ